MLSSIGFTQAVVIQGGALLIDIFLALVLSLLYQRALDLSAPEVALIDPSLGRGRAHRFSGNYLPAMPSRCLRAPR